MDSPPHRLVRLQFPKPIIISKSQPRRHQHWELHSHRHAYTNPTASSHAHPPTVSHTNECTHQHPPIAPCRPSKTNGSGRDESSFGFSKPTWIQILIKRENPRHTKSTIRHPCCSRHHRHRRRAPKNLGHSNKRLE